ncbi:hypothetical protein SEA_WEASELS2_40 [Rhodococcus phage Weasels2]|uniref:Uncharacterized protein n=1 Tax=Rhodococcus phage Weasels2 TaxID=1897437 RepID=A0A1I9SA24_9CAUD|nr:hypothetical protein FDH04_gp040 [Rhodococcus phage Weasels2]AOZ63630.1 hypothetical protein SEA_WEASELS2_40 [Rhodococcus phage Weasels2]
MSLEEIENVLKENKDPRKLDDLQRVWPELYNAVKGIALTSPSQPPVVDKPQGYTPTKDELQLTSTTKLVGGISHFATPGDASTKGGYMGVSGEPADKPTDIYYCAMRWGYVAWHPTTFKPNGNLPGMTDEEKFRLKKYLATRKVRVTVIATGKTVVLRPADAGPSIGHRVVDVSPTVIHDILEAETDDQVRVEWVDPATPLG